LSGTMKVVIGIIGITILMVIFPIIMTSTHDLQTDQASQVFADVITAGVTTVTVTLTQPIWNSDAAYVDSIVSDGQGDTPTAVTAPASTKIVVGGLETSATRDLTVDYQVDALTDYTGMGALVGITPLLIWVSILGIVIAGIWFGIKGRG
jgi:hypothetical protein